MLIALAAGCLLTVQIDKVSAALPLLSEQLQLDLFASGWVVSLSSLMVALCGALGI